MARCLVTGHEGYIGSRLYAELEKPLKVAQGDKEQLNAAMNKIKGYLKI